MVAVIRDGVRTDLDFDERGRLTTFGGHTVEWNNDGVRQPSMVDGSPVVAVDATTFGRVTGDGSVQWRPFELADAWGEDSAYMGWSWTMGPNAAQLWSSEFLNNLKFNTKFGRGLTVAEAHDMFLETHSGHDGSIGAYAPASKNMKIYGSTENIIDTRKAVAQ